MLALICVVEYGRVTILFEKGVVASHVGESADLVRDSEFPEDSLSDLEPTVAGIGVEVKDFLDSHFVSFLRSLCQQYTRSSGRSQAKTLPERFFFEIEILLDFSRKSDIFPKIGSGKMEALREEGLLLGCQLTA